MEIFPVVSPIPGKKNIGKKLGMGCYEKIRENPFRKRSNDRDFLRE